MAINAIRILKTKFVAPYNWAIFVNGVMQEGGFSSQEAAELYAAENY